MKFKILIELLHTLLLKNYIIKYINILMYLLMITCHGFKCIDSFWVCKIKIFFNFTLNILFS